MKVAVQIDGSGAAAIRAAFSSIATLLGTPKKIIPKADQSEIALGLRSLWQTVSDLKKTIVDTREPL